MLERESATHLSVVTNFFLLIPLSNCCVHLQTEHRDNPVELISYTPPYVTGLHSLLFVPRKRNLPLEGGVYGSLPRKSAEIFQPVYTVG
ncbi:hypothetical protein C0J52_02740 [Blattella germanica]|nr:hypothetical protein C0J52_02740 [Blattella germanica]